MQFGQNIVIDCSYEDKMVWREAVNAAKQMTFVFGDNRIHKEPFNMHLCNVHMEGNFMKQFKKNIPSISEPWFPLNIHQCSYLDLFPKKDLVYLTPHCREELSTYNHDAVYIVGCMVDKVIFFIHLLVFYLHSEASLYRASGHDTRLDVLEVIQYNNNV